MNFTKADVHNFVNETLNSIPPSSIEGAINWGDLKCVEVLFVEDEIYITIDEAAPSAINLIVHVQNKVKEEFGKPTLVNCEW